MRYRKVEGGYILCLARDERIIESLGLLAEKEKILCGAITGIGAVKNTRLGFYHLHLKKYDERLISEECELVNLSGNFTWLNEKPVVHCHVTIGTTSFQALAGHLFEAEIAVTGEFHITTKDSPHFRKFDEAMGLNLWSV